MTVAVSDSRSNGPEQIVHAAECIGKAKQRRAVFVAIYHGKKQLKTVGEISDATGLSRKRVLEEGRKLATKGIVAQDKVDGEIGYRKDDFYHANKAKILALASDPAKRAKVPTKRNPSRSADGGLTVKIKLPRGVRFEQPKFITIDEIDSFERVRKVLPAGNLAATVSEKAFKQGLLKILRQGGAFKDWGGEANDVFTGRLVYRGRRYRAAFALKGPGLKAKLTPARMGKNGDQIQRLFSSPADFFFVQHWQAIDESVVALMEALATKASIGGSRVYFGTIDGQDSQRLYAAYRNLF
ncbi:hypothetical protein [Anaeromyxobacter diazotrophicus]|uniref:Uncharacterized protein n=1 Tax=Anaeromyxobacter diazotrophicus TaxID=2590199 RepID=A0A7I9VPY9_9BACT|nr:hypothetical protein [Anaeromyxobacter diazotrophicus]GEJ58421.1 hypothetical protein AMYX_31620 [Anaeromyxobacter diazotrophicus]